MNKRTANVVRAMSPTGGPGSLFWGTLEGPTPADLLDYPVVKASSMASTTTTGTVLAILGSFRDSFLIADWIGVQMEWIQNVVNSSGIPVGQRGLVAHKRVASQVLDAEGFRLLLT